MAAPLITAQQIHAIAREFRRRQAIPSVRSAKEWQGVPVGIRDEAFFSAKVFHAQHVAELKANALKAINGQRVKLKSLRIGAGTETPEDSMLMTRSVFVREMRQAALERSLAPTGPRATEDIASAPRLRLIFDMAEQRTFNKARWETSNDPDLLDAYPAQELFRESPRDVPRDWEARWAAASDAVNGEGVAKDGRMVALKDSPIWTELSVFDEPFPPFDYGSGMGVRDVSRVDAVEMGLLGWRDKIDDPGYLFDQQKHASVENLPEVERDWLLEQLRAELGDAVKYDEATGDISFGEG